MDVFLLWHVHEMPGGEEDVKLLGVYSSADRAEEARQRALTKPGFRDSPEGLEVSRNVVERDEWTEGYITVTHADLLREDLEAKQNQNLGKKRSGEE